MGIKMAEVAERNTTILYTQNQKATKQLEAP